MESSPISHCMLTQETKLQQRHSLPLNEGEVMQPTAAKEQVSMERTVFKPMMNDKSLQMPSYLDSL